MISALLAVIVAAAPTPTPTPVALQYTELSRMIMPGSQQPEPGSYQADLAAATAGAVSAVNAATTPTPAPKRRGLGGMIAGALSGNPMGANPGGPPGGMAGAMGGMQAGSATRYTFYYSKSWIREDDLARQISYISKCPQHQYITLNLANKTYTISDTSPKGCNKPPSGMVGRAAGFSNDPGSVDITMKSSSKNLGPKTVEGIGTTGTDSSMDMSIANATGSCSMMGRSPGMHMRRIAYVSGIHKPHAFCPLVNAGYTGMPGNGSAMGGCKPQMHSTGGGMPGYGDNLEMWVLTFMGQVDSLMERGDVAWLYKPKADPLFEIPPGFTEQK